MKQYVCYYCDFKSDTFEYIIEHLTSLHILDCLKYRELELNEVSGTVSYRTKAHINIVPADGDIVVTADNKVGILKRDRSKKKKLNTPCKIRDTENEIYTEQSATGGGVSEYKSIETLHSEMHIGAPIVDNTTYDSDIEELIRLMLVIAEKLRQFGYLETYSKWCHMMSHDTFPMENICFR